MSTGNVVEIIGAVIDVEFPRDSIPKVYDALKLGETGLTMEVQAQLGDGVVRTIALGATDGLRRGMEVKNTGDAIRVPVGQKTLGRIMDVLGNPIDNQGEIGNEDSMPIHRKPPKFEDQSSATEILETGIKVIDLVMPIAKGGKIGLFGGAGVGKTATEYTQSENLWRKIMKKIILTISIVLMVGFFAASVYAWGCGGMYGSGYNNGMHRGGNYNGAGYNDSYQPFNNDTQALRSSIAADRAELNALMAGTNPDPERARQLSEQSSKSEDELRTKAREYNITGNGYGMMGYGNGWNCGINGHNHNFSGCW